MTDANPDAQNIAQENIEDEPPPVFGTWTKAYLFVLAYTAVLIALFYIFTDYFAP